MTQQVSNSITLFKGLKNDEDIKQVPFEYLYRIKNFNYPNEGLLGLEKILFPQQIVKLSSSPIDLLFDYKFLDQYGILRNEIIAVTDGTLYKNILTNAESVDTTFSAGLCTAVIFNDKLYIANGNNYVKVYDGNLGIVSEMGAPTAIALTASGNPNGTYYYAMTYLTAGGEEVIGSISNTITVSSKQIKLNLPIGYTGTLTRKIYRTENNSQTLKLLTTIGNNTDLTYTDNIADSALGVPIPATNNELPKPKFLIIANQKMYACGVDNHPTQLFISTTNIDVLDSASYEDISNYGYDNTPISGIGYDFSKVIVGTNKNIFLVDPSDDSVILSRANIGILNGYTVRQIPASGKFSGGLFFVSTLNDVRLMSGLQALPVSTSIDNITTENWAQNIRGSLEADLTANQNVYAEFYNYRYHLAINSIRYVFDIRTMGWTYHDIQSTTYKSQPTFMGIVNNFFYNGQNDGWIEQEYVDIQYRGEDVEAYIESPYIDVSNKFKFIEKFLIWLYPSNGTEIKICVTTDDNVAYDKTNTVSINGGVFDSQFFQSPYFLVERAGLDYRVVHVNKPCRWIKYKLTNTIGSMSYQGFEIYAQQLANKE